MNTRNKGTQENKRKLENSTCCGTDKRVKMSDNEQTNIAEILLRIDRTTKETKNEMAQFKEQINTIGDRVSVVENTVDEISKTIDQKIDQKISDALKKSSPNGDQFKTAFWSSRRSIVIYPARAPNQGQYLDEFKVFLKRYLGFTESEVSMIDIMSTKPVLKRRRDVNGEWKMVKMIVANLRRREDRDHIMARIGKLVGNSDYRMEMNIPDHLASLYRNLEKKAYEIRKNEGKKTSVRYNDDDHTLMLLVREPNQPWTRYNDK